MTSDVLTGGGAELAGLADFAQGALGKPVRIGKPQHVKGLAEAHATPGFSTLSGLVLYLVYGVGARDLGERLSQRERRRAFRNRLAARWLPRKKQAPASE